MFRILGPVLTLFLALRRTSSNSVFTPKPFCLLQKNKGIHSVQSDWKVNRLVRTTVCRTLSESLAEVLSFFKVLIKEILDLLFVLYLQIL